MTLNLLLFAITVTIFLEIEFDFIFYVPYRSEEISPTVGEGEKMYSVLFVHVSKVCIVLSQGGRLMLPAHEYVLQGGTWMHPDGGPLGNMLKVYWKSNVEKQKM